MVGLRRPIAAKHPTEWGSFLDDGVGAWLVGTPHAEIRSIDRSSHLPAGRLDAGSAAATAEVNKTLKYSDIWFQVLTSCLWLSRRRTSGKARSWPRQQDSSSDRGSDAWSGGFPSPTRRLGGRAAGNAFCVSETFKLSSHIECRQWTIQVNFT